MIYPLIASRLLERAFALRPAIASFEMHRVNPDLYRNWLFPQMAYEM